MAAEDHQPALVSVLIATYNGQHFIAETLDSVLAQTYRPIEVIVVDDGSSDKTWEVLQSYGSRIRAIRQKNGGVAAARNTGLREARGEFIALMDHDDLCEPERIAVQMAFMHQHPGVGLCCSEFSAFDRSGMLAQSYSGEYYAQCHSSRGGVMSKFPARGSLDISSHVSANEKPPVLVPTYTGRIYEDLALGNFVHPPTTLFRRSMVDQVGEFDLDARMMCDWDWLIRVSRITEVGYIDRSLLRYRRSEGQISSTHHHPRASIDSLRVGQKIHERDPSLYQRRPAQFRRHLGVMSLDAADSNAEVNRWRALRLLVSSVGRYATVNDRTFRTLFKIAVPRAVLGSIRKLRGKGAGTTLLAYLLASANDALDVAELVAESPCLALVQTLV